VIEPRSPIPARSSNCGSSEKTLGVYPRVGRLAHRQADFALRHGEPRHRVHHQQHVLAFVAEMFGNGHRQETRL
jgi:hypothetical protein